MVGKVKKSFRSGGRGRGGGRGAGDEDWQNIGFQINENLKNWFKKLKNCKALPVVYFLRTKDTIKYILG
jgi:hypothetical protein